MTHHVILGNGPTGVIAAETLRKADPRCYITLVGDEPELPYSRMAIPYLLVGNIAEHGTHLRKNSAHYDLQRITMLHARAEKLDTQAKTVTLSNGTLLKYDKLLLATGSTPMKPPITGIDSPGVYPCWTLDNARQILKYAKPGARVLQMGAGFIGCIIMEALATRGTELTVVEMGDRMVPRMMTPKAGGMMKDWVEKKGVKVYTNTKVEAIANIGGNLKVKLSNGETLPVDLVISATGVKPNIAFLKDSGVKTNVGVVVDKTMRTNVLDVFAAGDVAEAIDFSTGKYAVNAIQPNAADQGRLAASNMLGQSNASEGSLALNVLDAVGLISTSFGQWWGVDAKEGGSSVELVDEASSKYLSLQFKDDVLVGATSLGMTDHVGALRGLIQTRTSLGKWKDKLMHNPTQLMEAYLECAQAQASNTNANALGRLRAIA
ncbi:MAG: NADH-dependent phenylglyoxylate dehydrogenase subunit epsilon [Pseudomonadota bacterium]